MPKTAAQMVSDANARVPKITQAEAAAAMEKGAVLLDVREPGEVADGKAEGAVDIPRGLLEFRADPNSPIHDARLSPDVPVILYCAAGGRAALAGVTLQELGYEQVFNLGALTDWTDGGGALA